jgi:hypothetical protein
VPSEGVFDRGEVVVGQHQRRRGRGGRDAGRAGQRERRDARSRCGEQTVDVAVVATGELDHELAPGEPAGEANRRHGRLGARRDEAHLVDRRAGDDLLGELDLGRRGRPERRAVGDRALDRVDHLWVGMAEDHRAPRADQVDVLVAVDVVEVRPGRASHEARRAADRPECPHRTVDASRGDVERPGEEVAGPGGASPRARVTVHRSHGDIVADPVQRVTRGPGRRETVTERALLVTMCPISSATRVERT